MILRKNSFFKEVLNFNGFDKYQTIHYKTGFTLAEVLIALAIIGIVAVLMINFVFNNIMDNARYKQSIGARHKFAKAIENMALNYGIGPYYGTGDDRNDATIEFVQKLSNYYNINRICSISNLDDCFGYKIMSFPSGETFDITELTNGKLFKNNGSENLSDDFDVETVGVFGLDGTRFILAYNKNCNYVEPGIFNWNNDGTYNDSMGCISAVMDIDGNRAPNKMGKDIFFVNATGIGDNCIIKIGDACFGSLFYPEGVSYEECVENKSAWGLTYCLDDNQDKLDYYAGAAKSCGGKTNLISKESVIELLEKMYSTKDSANKYYDYIENSATAFGFPEPYNAATISSTTGDFTVFVWISGYSDTAIRAPEVNYSKAKAYMAMSHRFNPSADLAVYSVLAVCRVD